MRDELVAEYYRQRGEARALFGDLVRALNRRDTYDQALNHARHPLIEERRQYLAAELIGAHHRTEHLQKQLADYDAKLQRLERQLGMQKDDPPPLPRRPAAADPAQPSLFGQVAGTR